MNDIILASKSKFRAQLLKNAGVKFTQQTADINEREIEEPLVTANMPPKDIAEILAIAKAQNVSQLNQTSVVVGSDQLLEFENELLHKVKDMEGARRRLLKFSGKTHRLHTSIAIVKDEEVIWSSVETAEIKFRNLTPEFIGRHLAEAGDDVLQSVGAYQIEGVGVQLFEEIKGDYFTIMGLPLIQLLEQLRRMKLLET